MNEPINPGEGWRIIKGGIGEVRKEGDEEPVEGFWAPAFPLGMSIDKGTVRRRIEKTQEQKDMEACNNYRWATPEGTMQDCWFAALAYARKGEGK